MLAYQNRLNSAVELVKVGGTEAGWSHHSVLRRAGLYHERAVLAINERLGFRKHPVWVHVVKIMREGVWTC